MPPQPAAPDPRQIIPEVEDRLSVKVTSVNEIPAGANNRLFRFGLQTGGSLLVKYYYVDERQRLEREFTALRVLESKGFKDVPRPYFADPAQNYAVYSFEAGSTKPAQDLTRSDLIHMMDFLVRLHAYTPDDISVSLPTGVLACFSIQDMVGNIAYRCDQFRQALATPGQLSEQVEQFAHQYDVLRAMDGLTQQALAGTSQADIERPIAHAARRLCVLDFGPHNSLFRAKGRPCFVDFEYFGWDDPLHELVGFVGHDQLRAVPRQDRLSALEHYKNHTNLPSGAFDRLPVMLRLFAVEWLAIHLVAVTPAKIKLRRFGDPAFDRATYEEGQLVKFQARLNSDF